ncbi:MAG TPA: hypothetical protein VND93_34095 [Myxococcales bacterium]|nr:hypothetical protein [Myxococcales bacterium]
MPLSILLVDDDRAFASVAAALKREGSRWRWPTPSTPPARRCRRRRW